MDSVKWIANIHQKYTVDVEAETLGGVSSTRGVRTTQIISLFLIAESAQEAVDKADGWVKSSGIENAYVSDVYRADIEELQIGYGK